MTRILCLGMSALDAIYRVPMIPAHATKVLATAFTESGGGMAANASVATARLGGDVQYWGRLGDDALGERILRELAAEGVGVSHVRRVSGRVSPSAAILVAPDGERLVCAYNDPALDRDPRWLPLAEVRSFDAILADVRWPEGAAAVLDAARAAGIPAVLDGDIGPPEVLLDLADRATRIDHFRLRETRRAQPVHANPLDGVVAGRGRDHLNVVPFTREPMREVAQMQLDAAEPRKEPVADQRDAEGGRTGSR